MKASDLMVGDWVRVPRLNKNGKVYRVDCANGEGNGFVAVLGGDFHENDIEPVLLTPEILRKNGFGFTKSDFTDSVWNGWWIYKGLELATACLNRDEEWPCFINIYDSNIKCEYVHQLQHALKIAKIEKEIEI